VTMGFVEVTKVLGLPRADRFSRGHDRKALFAMIKKQLPSYFPHRVSREDVANGVFHSEHPTLSLANKTSTCNKGAPNISPCRVVGTKCLIWPIIRKQY
jgi:hypothetical protein